MGAHSARFSGKKMTGWDLPQTSDPQPRKPDSFAALALIVVISHLSIISKKKQRMTSKFLVITWSTHSDTAAVSIFHNQSLVKQPSHFTILRNGTFPTVAGALLAGRRLLPNHENDRRHLLFRIGYPGEVSFSFLFFTFLSFSFFGGDNCATRTSMTTACWSLEP